MAGRAPSCGNIATASLHWSGPQTAYGPGAASRAACRSSSEALGASRARTVCIAYGSTPFPVVKGRAPGRI
eukprot:11215206-Lingulodinium_polyedra.AAC.1